MLCQSLRHERTLIVFPVSRPLGENQTVPFDFPLLRVRNIAHFFLSDLLTQGLDEFSGSHIAPPIMP